MLKIKLRFCFIELNYEKCIELNNLQQHPKAKVNKTNYHLWNILVKKSIISINQQISNFVMHYHKSFVFKLFPFEKVNSFRMNVLLSIYKKSEI